MYWLRIASEEGETDAKNLLGTALKNGEGVRQDYVEAMKLFRMAAKGGFPAAAIEIGNLYFDGYGTKKSNRLAIHWWWKAAVQGDVEAKKLLKRHSPPTTKR